MHYYNYCVDCSFYLFKILGAALISYYRDRQNTVMNEIQILEMFRNIEEIDEYNENNIEEEQLEANELMHSENNQLRQRQN